MTEDRTALHRDKLLRMAGQIATFFRSQPGRSAPESVAAHLNDFWTPRMRQDLAALVASGACADPVIVGAVRHLRLPAQPPAGPATEPAADSSAAPATGPGPGAGADAARGA